MNSSAPATQRVNESGIFASRGQKAQALQPYLRQRLGDPKAQTTTTSTTTTVYTTTTTDHGPDFIVVSSTVTGNIYSWDSWSHQTNTLVEFAATNPSSVALDHNFGFLYYTDPKNRAIVRYELAIRNNQLNLYDYQPVPIAQGVDADWIVVDDSGNLYWTDPAGHRIMKMYLPTIQLIASGAAQPNELQTVSYMDIYLQTGKVVPSTCFSSTHVFPENCTLIPSCTLCQSLSTQPYIFGLYEDLGQPSGLQILAGNKLLWGNFANGFTLGTVVEAQAEPRLQDGATTFSTTALSHLWDSVIDFVQMPSTQLGGGNLFLTTNGTLGIPPIPGDVVGAIVVITPGGPNGKSEFLPVDWNFVKPRSLVWNGDEKLYIADDSGVHYINSGMAMEMSLEYPVLDLPGASGLTMLLNSAPCYPMLAERGLEPSG